MVSFLPLINYQIFAGKFLLKWILSLIGVHVDWNQLTDSVPSFETIDFTLVISSEVYSLVDQWFPCEYAMICFSSYIICAIIVYGVNWVLGLIPTVS